MNASKRQLSFEAEPDVELFLSHLDADGRTLRINKAIRIAMENEARVDFNDGRQPVHFWDLPEEVQSEVHSNLMHGNLDSDADSLQVMNDTDTQNWRINTARYLALHEAKLGFPLKLKV